MSETPAQTDAAKRAAARKAKILARGNDGLAKLAQTARGDEADTLYAQDTGSSRPSSATASISRTPIPIPTSNSHATSSQPRSDSTFPQDQQAMSAQLEAMMSMFSGGDGAGTGGMPDMQRLMAQMMGVDPSGSGQNLLGDLDDPAGLGSNGNGQPNDPFGFQGAANGGFPSFSGVPTKKSKVERYFPSIHAVSVIALLVFVVAWWEPNLGPSKWTDRALKQSWTERWALLAGRRGMWRAMKGEVTAGVEVLPVFWAFTTLELILQTTRFFILNSPPPPHSLISTFLPVLPPAIARPLVTGSRYLTIIAQTYKDGCMFVFGLGMIAVLAEWLSGRIVFG